MLLDANLKEVPDTPDVHFDPLDFLDSVEVPESVSVEPESPWSDTAADPVVYARRIIEMYHESILLVTPARNDPY